MTETIYTGVVERNLRLASYLEYIGAVGGVHYEIDNDRQAIHPYILPGKRLCLVDSNIGSLRVTMFTRPALAMRSLRYDSAIVLPDQKVAQAEDALPNVIEMLV